MNRLSAVIITHNEEHNIGRCINSLKGIADEIVVVDSGSTDNTRSICERLGARFVAHAWENYSSQKNYAESLVRMPWVLSIDADECLDEQLRLSLKEFLDSNPSDNTVGCVRRLNNYKGRWIRHGGWYPDEKIRIWHHGSCRWEGIVHEELRFEQPMATTKLAGKLLHYSYSNIGELAARHQKYAMLAAEKAFLKGKHCRCGALMFRPWWTFVRNYFIKGGVLDGSAGFEVCLVSAYYTFLKYARLRELENTKH